MLMSEVGQFKFSPALLPLRNSSYLPRDRKTFSNTLPSKPSRTLKVFADHEAIVLPVNGATSDAFVAVQPYYKLPQSINVKVEINVQDPTWFHSKSQGEPTFSDTLDFTLVSSKAQEGSEGHSIKGTAKKIDESFIGELIDELIGHAKYESSLTLPANFGELGAVMVKNGNKKELYFNNIVVDGFRKGKVTITCKSWVHSKDDNPNMRVFFTNKSYLPSKTPIGLKKLREKELKELRGNGEGERKAFDRIYDYDTYNDLGDPDKNLELLRPVLGGHEHPYPRRCRTGRGPSQIDPLSEKQVKDTPIYVPRDEQFSLVKNLAFVLPYIFQKIRSYVAEKEIHGGPDAAFPNFTTIDSLYNDGLPIPDWIVSILHKFGLDKFAETIYEGGKWSLRFPPPKTFQRDRFSWLRDDEFSRQTLAGVNPFSIQLVTEWPMKSKLEPYLESAITDKIVEREIGGIMTCDEAIKKKRLFMLDYHDLLLPFVQKVRELNDTTLYASRTLFFLRDDNTLKPIAIELSCPSIDDEDPLSEVFTPSPDATSSWLWMFAKAHVSAHDSGYHQLVVHWLRTHCCMEPYIIAANRQLSAMHPIYRLLYPHFRYTMTINSLARKLLISADGVVEQTFSPGKYAMELSSVAYDKLWRFDMEALPADLIRRGMAVEDPKATHGLKLTIEDYPFANDALLLWDGIKSWVTDYVNHYYRDAKTIENDTELQAWWNEVRTKGHADKKDEPWWPVLNTADSLIQTLSTIIWTASGHHAAVNFGQYAFAGYFPSRPTIARTEMPTASELLLEPEKKLLECLPTKDQAAQVMTVMYTLSNHSPDEEYIGKQIAPSWSEEPAINDAFKKFQNKMQKMEGEINERNDNEELKNRVGAGIVPYQIFKPNSEFGLTGMGVPNSISI